MVERSETKYRWQICVLKGGGSFARLPNNRTPTPARRRSMSA